MNRNYRKGYKLENDFVNKLKEVGFDIAFRSAGSHSPIDVVAFDIRKKLIYVYQCKTDGRFSKKDTKLLKSMEGKWIMNACNATSLNNVERLW